MFSILMTSLTDKLLILQWEVWLRSLFGLWVNRTEESPYLLARVTNIAGPSFFLNARGIVTTVNAPQILSCFTLKWTRIYSVFSSCRMKGSIFAQPSTSSFKQFSRTKRTEMFILLVWGWKSWILVSLKVQKLSNCKLATLIRFLPLYSGFRYAFVEAMALPGSCLIKLPCALSGLNFRTAPYFIMHAVQCM